MTREDLESYLATARVADVQERAAAFATRYYCVRRAIKMCNVHATFKPFPKNRKALCVSTVFTLTADLSLVKFRR